MIKEICEKLDFPAEASDYLEDVLKDISGNFSIMDEMSIAMDNYFCENDDKYMQILENLPEDTTLQRRFKKYLIEGNKMGNGFGVILFDGEKIIK